MVIVIVERDFAIELRSDSQCSVPADCGNSQGRMLTPLPDPRWRVTCTLQGCPGDPTKPKPGPRDVWVPCMK